jgi:hypothetical protein
MEKNELDAKPSHDLVEDGLNESSDIAMYDEKETKAILRKIDWRLLPMLTVLYVLAYIDRSNSKTSSATVCLD